MRTAAGQCLNPAPTPVDVADVARLAPQPAPSPTPSPTRVADRGVTDRRLGAEHSDATQKLRNSRRLLTESAVFLMIFAFIVGVGAFIAPRVLDTGTHISPVGVVTLPPMNVANCPLPARPHGLRSDACALPPDPTGSHHCC